MKSAKKINSRKRVRPEDDPDEEYVSSILLHREEQKVQVSSRMYFFCLYVVLV